MKVGDLVKIKEYGGNDIFIILSLIEDMIDIILFSSLIVEILGEKQLVIYF